MYELISRSRPILRAIRHCSVTACRISEQLMTSWTLHLPPAKMRRSAPERRSQYQPNGAGSG